MLFSELPYLDRFDAAAAAGFTAVEVSYPYEIPAAETKRALIRNGLDMVQIAAPPPNYAGGPRGFAAQPELMDRFRYDMRRVFRYAGVFRAQGIEIFAGDAQGQEAQDCLIENLQYAADAAPPGLTLTLAPREPEHSPQAFLSDFETVCDVIQKVNRPNVGLQFDTYDAAQLEGDAVACFERWHPHVRHIRVADAPARRAPLRGTIDFPGFFQAVTEQGYKGWVTAAYAAPRDVAKSMSWKDLV